MSLSLLAGAWTVGLFIGLIGIGGIFLIPLLVAALGLTLESAIGTALVTFTATGFVSTAIYAAKGRIDWRLAILTSLGSVVGGVVGARIGVALSGVTLTFVFAAFLLFAGVAAIVRSFGHSGDADNDRRLAIIPALAVGTIVGVGSGLTGVGGPAILVPLLLLLRIPATVAIAASQPNGIAASASGALGHVLYGHVDFSVAAWLIVVVGAGVVVGSLLHRRFSARALQPLIGGACVVLAIWTILHRVNAT